MLGTLGRNLILSGSKCELWANFTVRNIANFLSFEAFHSVYNVENAQREDKQCRERSETVLGGGTTGYMEAKMSQLKSR